MNSALSPSRHMARETCDVPALTGDEPVLTGDMPALTGDVPALTRDVPALTGRQVGGDGELDAGRGGGARAAPQPPGAGRLAAVPALQLTLRMVAAGSESGRQSDRRASGGRSGGARRSWTLPIGSKRPLVPMSCTPPISCRTCSPRPSPMRSGGGAMYGPALGRGLCGPAPGSCACGDRGCSRRRARLCSM